MEEVKPFDFEQEIEDLIQLNKLIDPHYFFEKNLMITLLERLLEACRQNKDDL